MTKTRYIVYEPQTEYGDAIIDVFTDELAARESYEYSITEGTASIETGCYLAKVSDVTPAILESFYSNPNKVIASEFKGLNVTILESFGAARTWSQGALDFTDEEFDNSDETYAITN